MTSLYFTIDTEYSVGQFRKAGFAARADIFARSILGETNHGSVGILYQMDVLDRHGLKAVFFVDPMPALVWGIQAIKDVISPIVARGHDVQLHLHTEWLEFASNRSPVLSKTVRNIKDLTLGDQRKLLDYARNTLIAAGAAPPVAFRAGNYGANDDTLRALASLGIPYDTSHCPGIAVSDCDISLTADDRDALEHCNVTEVPISCIGGPGSRLRHFQLTALTDTEIVAALRHASQHGQPLMTLVSHSFELLGRDKPQINRIVKRRFERLCATLERMPEVTTATYTTEPPAVCPSHVASVPMPYRPLRAAHRFAEQALSNMLYGSK